MCRASWISLSRSLRESSWAGSLTCEVALDEAELEGLAELEGGDVEAALDEAELEAALDEAELEGLAELEGGDVEAALDEAELEAAPSDWRKYEVVYFVTLFTIWLQFIMSRDEVSLSCFLMRSFLVTSSFILIFLLILIFSSSSFLSFITSSTCSSLLTSSSLLLILFFSSATRSVAECSFR